MIKLIRTDPTNLHFQLLVNMLDDELRIRDGEEHVFYAQFNKTVSIRHAVLAYYGEEAVGSGTLRFYNETTAEIKRMFVKPEFRGQGIAGSILAELETWAGELEFTSCILETGHKQPEAIALYKKAGYLPIPNYGQYAGVYNSICMRKELNGRHGE